MHLCSCINLTGFIFFCACAGLVWFEHSWYWCSFQYDLCHCCYIECIFQSRSAGCYHLASLIHLHTSDLHGNTIAGNHCFCRIYHYLVSFVTWLWIANQKKRIGRFWAILGLFCANWKFKKRINRRIMLHGSLLFKPILLFFREQHEKSTSIRTI